MSKTKSNILVIAAHPDDEVLGCGGTIARHADAGDGINILFVADGVGARNTKSYKTEKERRYKASKKAAEILGANKPLFLDFPDNKLDSIPLINIVKEVELKVSKLKPQTIYTHHGGDLNIDHQITHRAVVTACRPLPESSVINIFTFEVLSSTEWFTSQQQSQFIATRFVDISNCLEKKISALKEYDEEMRDFPHSRSYESVEALAKIRGSNAGLKAAEAFGVIREIVTL